MKAIFYPIGLSLFIIVLLLLLQQIDLRYQFKIGQTQCPQGKINCNSEINPEFLN